MGLQHLLAHHDRDDEFVSLIETECVGYGQVACVPLQAEEILERYEVA